MTDMILEKYQKCSVCRTMQLFVGCRERRKEIFTDIRGRKHLAVWIWKMLGCGHDKIVARV
jgi:hypothetical protein